MARVIVDVSLKPEILDPQGRAVQGALGRLGLAGVADVRQGKQFVIDIAGELTQERRALLDELAGSLLCNPVIEDYTLTITDATTPTAAETTPTPEATTDPAAAGTIAAGTTPTPAAATQTPEAATGPAATETPAETPDATAGAN